MISRRRWMLGAGAAVAVMLAVAVLAARGSDSSAEPVLPGMDLERLDGGRASLADYRGRPLVVNFFASWCVPCLAEMPAFEQVHQGYADQVAFLGVNLQDPVEDGRAIVERTGITYDTVRDPDGDLFAALGATAMPTTVFVDADGQIVQLYSGELSGDDLAARIDDLLLA